MDEWKEGNEQSGLIVW